MIKEEFRKAMSEFKEDARKIKEDNAKKESAPAVTPARRSFHWGVVIFDAILAVLFAFTIIGLPLTILFGVSAVRRYEKHLK